jgi:hypothetical protein
VHRADKVMYRHPNPSLRTQTYDVERSSKARGGSHDMEGAGERVASEAASPGLLREAGSSLLSPVGRGPPGGVIVDKHLVGRTEGATLHRALVMSSMRGGVEEGLKAK